MTANSISAASLSQDVLASSDSNQLRQSLQALQNSLTSGDLKGAQAAFNTVQTLTQGLATAGAGSLASNTQLSTDLATLGKALGSGNLSASKSAFATLQSDLKSRNSPSLTNETNVASQSAQLIQELLSTGTVNSSSSSTSDSTVSVLERVYGSSSSLNVHA